MHANALNEKNLSLNLAEWMKKIPIVYFPWGLQSAAIRFKNSMQENGSPIENQNDDFTDTSSTDNEYSKWVDNQGDEVKNVFGFNSSAELVNGRAAMIGFLMLILTELVFSGRPVTSSIFGIN